MLINLRGSYLINGFGKGTTSVVPFRAARNEGFSPWGSPQFTASVHYTRASIHTPAEMSVERMPL